MRRGRQKGFILALVLLVVFILSMTMIVVARHALLEYKSIEQHQHHLVAFLSAQSVLNSLTASLITHRLKLPESDSKVSYSVRKIGIKQLRYDLSVIALNNDSKVCLQSQIQLVAPQSLQKIWWQEQC